MENKSMQIGLNFVISVALVNLVFGVGGTLLDPLIPLIGLGVILVMRRK